MSEASDKTEFDQRPKNAARCLSGNQPVLTKLRKNRTLRCAAVLLSGMLLVGFERVPILREIGSFLVSEDPLQAAAAIIPLGGEGKPPLREIEAARLYRAGW